MGGRNLYILLNKLREAGERSDVAIPLRVFRDEVSRIYQSTPRSMRQTPMSRLVGLVAPSAARAVCATHSGMPAPVRT